MKTQVIDEKEWPENRTAKIGLLVNKKTNKAFGKKKKYQGYWCGKSFCIRVAFICQ